MCQAPYHSESVLIHPTDSLLYIKKKNSYCNIIPLLPYLRIHAKKTTSNGVAKVSAVVVVVVDCLPIICGSRTQVSETGNKH